MGWASGPLRVVPGPSRAAGARPAPRPARWTIRRTPATAVAVATFLAPWRSRSVATRSPAPPRSVNEVVDDLDPAKPRTQALRLQCVAAHDLRGREPIRQRRRIPCD